MSDFFIGFVPYQPTAAPILLMDYLFSDNILQGTSLACVTDLIPPTFAGVETLSIESFNQIRVTWSAGTDVSVPIRYEVYIRVGTSVGLFSLVNIVGITDKLQYDIFVMPDGSSLDEGATYCVGVRAVDAVGNRNTNTVSQSIIAPGLALGGIQYAPEAAFSIDTTNQFRGTIWGLRNWHIMTGSLLGFASYQVYDAAGNAVVSMHEEYLTANSNGMFHITPIASALTGSLNQYLVKINVVMDGAIRSEYIPLVKDPVSYDAKGQFSINALNQFQGTLWATSNSMVCTGSRIGTASYTVYDATGAAVSGLSQSGLVADGNGRYQITPVSALPLSDLTHYSVKIAITVDGIERVGYRGFQILG
jgi:hypothetical protein